MSTKVILKRTAIRMADLDENAVYYYEDYKTKGKIIFYPFEPNGRKRVCVYCKQKGYAETNCFTKIVQNNKIKALMIKD